MSNLRRVDEAKRRLDEMAAEFSGKKPDLSAEAQKKAEAYNAAFWEAMHTGMPQNSMKEGSDGAGGYLVPDTYEKDLVQALSERNVIRQVATTIPTTHKMHIPIAYGMGDAQWVIEGQPWSFNKASFGEVVLDAHKLGTSILASDEMLEDGGVDLEKHIRSFFAERIGEAEEEAFIHGNGKGKPLGLIHQADVGAVSEQEGEITMDDMVNLEFSLRRPYRENAVWLISEEAYGRLRCVRQYNGRLLWNENLQEGEPQKLFGHQIYVCKALDKVAPGSITILRASTVERSLRAMATKTGNTAAGPVMLRPDSRNKYDPNNLILYRTSLALYRNMTDEGIFNEEEYCHIRTILTKKYGLSSDSIFAECA